LSTYEEDIVFSTVKANPLSMHFKRMRTCARIDTVKPMPLSLYHCVSSAEEDKELKFRYGNSCLVSDQSQQTEPSDQSEQSRPITTNWAI